MVLFEKPSRYHGGHSHIGSGVLWKIIVTQHSPPLHQEMQLELYHAKRKAFIHFVQKRCRVLWAPSHLRWTEFWSDESFQPVFGKNRILRAKDEKDHLDCYHRKVQKPASVMVWGSISAIGPFHVILPYSIFTIFTV